MKKTAEAAHLNDTASNYDPDAYQKPSVTVDMAVCTIFAGAVQVLLVKRPFPPFKHFWAIPGGFVNIERKETLEAAALRKLGEETGIRGVFLEQLKTYGDPDRDPRMRVITVAYYGLVPYSRIVQRVEPEPRRYGLEWFPLTALPERLAFDHDAILTDLLARLQGKISYAPLAFSLLDPQFTWSDLQGIYEAVLGKKLLTPNFRRKLLSMYHLKELQEKKKTKGRPSRFLIYEGIKEL